MTTEQLRLRQLNRKLEVLREQGLNPPRGGWIREIREALGMSSSQLAKRLGVSKQAVAQHQRNEVSGSITLGTLQKTSAALECELVYALVPSADIGELRERRAYQVAKRVLERVTQSMALESQDVSSQEVEEQTRDLARQILEKQPRSLWDEP